MITSLVITFFSVIPGEPEVTVNGNERISPVPDEEVMERSETVEEVHSAPVELPPPDEPPTPPPEIEDEPEVSGTFSKILFAFKV